MAACEEAPAVIIDEERFARVNPDRVDGLVARYP
ncbi:MAG: hypothetical protein ACRDGN_06205 [bacterium]